MTNVLVGGKKREDVLAAQRQKIEREGKEKERESPLITGPSNLDDLLYTEESPELRAPALVKWAGEQTIQGQLCVLQSAREHAYLRWKGIADGTKEQSTRTCAIYFKENGMFNVAYGDSNFHGLNALLQLVRQDMSSARTGPIPGTYNKKDQLISGLLELAKRERRIFGLPTNYSKQDFFAIPYILMPEVPINSPFLNCPHIQAMLQDHAAPYEQWLAAQGETEVALNFLTPDNLIRKGVDDSTVLIRPVGIGGKEYGYQIYCTDHNDGFGDKWFGRGVARLRRPAPRVLDDNSNSHR